MNEIMDQFRKFRWRGGLACDKCAYVICSYHGKRPNGVFRYRCGGCHSFFSDFSGTFLAGSKIPLQLWCEAAHLLARTPQISLNAFQSALSVSHPTALRMRAMLQKALRILYFSKHSDSPSMPDDIRLQAACVHLLLQIDAPKFRS